MALLVIFRPKYSPRAWISYSSPWLSELQNPASHPRDEAPTGSHAATVPPVLRTAPGLSVAHVAKGSAPVYAPEIHTAPR